MSADFLASDFIITKELPDLLANAENNGVSIMSVIISPSRFVEMASISRFQSVNPPSKPLIAMERVEQEEVFVKVTRDIEQLLHIR